MGGGGVKVAVVMVCIRPGVGGLLIKVLQKLVC